MESDLYKCYRLGPFLIDSEIELPELEQLPAADGKPQVTLIVSNVPEHLEEPLIRASRWEATEDSYLLRIDGVARFLVERGKKISVQPDRNASSLDIRAYLLAPIFSALVHQRGMFALHGSSIKTPDGVVAFLGDSGAGKSTLAALLARRGYTIFSDDVCLFDSPAEEPLRVVRIALALKLWKGAVEYLGISADHLSRVVSSEPKFRIPLDVAPDRSLIRHLFFLEWTEDRDPIIRFEPIGTAEAIARTMALIHQEPLIRAHNRQMESFAWCGKVLTGASSCVFRRPKRFDLLEQVVDQLDQFLADL